MYDVPHARWPGRRAPSGPPGARSVAGRNLAWPPAPREACCEAVDPARSEQRAAREPGRPGQEYLDDAVPGAHQRPGDDLSAGGHSGEVMSVTTMSEQSMPPSSPAATPCRASARPPASDAGGQATVTDSPFVETKQALRGNNVIDAAHLDDAIATDIPSPGGGLRVRPLWHLTDPGAARTRSPRPSRCGGTASPHRPGAWLTTVARKRALDVLRGEATLRRPALTPCAAWAGPRTRARWTNRRYSSPRTGLTGSSCCGGWSSSRGRDPLTPTRWCRAACWSHRAPPG